MRDATRKPLYKFHKTALALVVAMPAAAAQAEEERLVLEEVTVTAQKREESLQDTPISLAAFDSRELEVKGVHDLTDLRGNVPNLQMTPHPNNAATTRIYMRGVGMNDEQITQDASTAVYIDGVYVARSQGLAMEVADVERIEVLRGPQGTLYGRNATGGAINFVTVAPQLDEWSFKQQLSSGSRGLFRSRSTINAPIGDTAAARFSYLTSQQEGFVDNPGSGEDRYGERDRDAWRADLRWQPTHELELRYSYDQSDIGDTPSFVAAVPLYPEVAERPERGSDAVEELQANDVTSSGHSLITTWDISPDITLKSITAYRELENFQNMDFHSGVFSPAPIYKNASQRNQEQFSQEIQLLGDALDNRLEYILGLYYFEEEADTSSRTLIPSSDVASYRVGEIENTATAVFGQGTWTPGILEDRLHLTLGLRSSRDERQARRATATELLDRGMIIPGVDDDGSNDFDRISPSLVAAFDLSERVNLYAKVVDGYKTGGYNVRASSAEMFARGFDEETLVSYELGIKSQLWDDRLRLNAAVFQSDYEDIQINVQSDPDDPRITDVLNAGVATVQGLELDLTALITDGLTANLRYGYLDADYEEIIDASGADIADNFRFVESPTHSVVADLDYRVPVSFGTLAANLGYSWQDDKFTSSGIDDGRYIVGDYALLNARLSLSDIDFAGGSLRAALWGKNLQDEEYYVAHFSLGVPSAVFGEPRSYGLDVIYEY